MPIFEYTCESCGKDFEMLVRSDTIIACEACGSVRVKKKLSAFAVNRSSSGTETPSCACGCNGGFQRGQCGSGMCGSE